MMATPIGVTENSRWLSEATPPEEESRNELHPEGMAEIVRSECRRPRWPIRKPNPLASLLDAGAGGRPCSGGVAALNHRLISVTPPGSSWKRIVLPIRRRQFFGKRRRCVLT